MGLSLPAAEDSTCWDSHTKMLCSILSFKLIFTSFLIHVEHNTFPYRPGLAKSFRFFRQKAKRSSKKDKEAKNWLQVCVVWYSFWDNKKANFLALQTQFLSLKCYYIYLWVCFICAHFVRMAAELCRLQKNSLLIKWYKIHIFILIAEFIQSKTAFLHLRHGLPLPCNG